MIESLRKYVCTHCGSDDVLMAAEVQWNTLEQRWECYSYLDTSAYNYCFECAESGYGVVHKDLVDLKDIAVFAAHQGVFKSVRSNPDAC